MRGRTRTMAAAAFMSVALVVSACGGGGGGEDTAPGTEEGTGQAGGEIVVEGCTPQNPLQPGNTAETCGGDILDAVLAKLVHYNADTAEPELDLAESIETTDNQNFTVKVKQGRMFHDGTEVKAKNFVDAWNFAAYFPNGQEGGYFMEPIAGYTDLQPPDEEGKQPPKAKTLSGLKVVDDYTFTIKTTAAVSNLPGRLGYTAFAPLPDSGIANPKAYGEKPVGAGPFKFDSKSTTEFVLSKFAEYKGDFAASVDKVTFRVYTDTSAAYNDVQANNLDVLKQIPSDRLVDDLYKSELPERNALRPTGTIATIAFSPIDENLKDVNLRKAISMAVDRNLINEQIFNGTRPPLDSWVAPVVPGYKAGQCGEACTFDAAKAKQMYDAAGGYKGGPLTLAVNGDGGHKPWADAACNSIKNTLGLDCRVNVTPDFATLLTQLDKKELKGTFRSAWQMDYPNIENFLTPIYAKGAGSNYTGYDNPEFEAKLKEAAAAKTEDEAIALYQEAELFLARDLPSFPVWSYDVAIGWSEKVTDVKLTAFGRVDYAAIKVK